MQTHIKNQVTGDDSTESNLQIIQNGGYITEALVAEGER